MIVYDLKCGEDHVFEAWFKDSAAYAAQAKGRKIICPVCGNKRVEKALMAPNIATKSERTPAPPDPRKAQFVAHMQALGELRKKVEESCDYVGPRFAEEARKIHYGESQARGIYGEATTDDAESLSDEGVEFAKIPWVPRQDA